MGALTFDPSPQASNVKDTPLAAAKDQAELMQWHYHLGHVTFTALNLMATKGEIPKRLREVKPPKCAGCLFGTMTKLLWHGKEAKTSHKVFVPTKLGECVLVNRRWDSSHN
jgi:hypothetical protein